MDDPPVGRRPSWPAVGGTILAGYAGVNHPCVHFLYDRTRNSARMFRSCAARPNGNLCLRAHACARGIEHWIELQMRRPTRADDLDLEALRARCGELARDVAERERDTRVV